MEDATTPVLFMWVACHPCYPDSLQRLHAGAPDCMRPYYCAFCEPID